MRWWIKAGVQKALSYAPRSEQLNYVLQRRVAQSLPVSDGQIRLHFEEALRHVDRYEQFGTGPLADARVYEFGAGWDLIGPVSLWALGVERQLLVDIQAHLRWNLVQHGLERLLAMLDELETLARRPVRRPPVASLSSLADLQGHLGIAYLAPLDARDTGFDGQSVDLITSTFTLEHIRRDDIAQILRESARLLAPAGVISSSIDLKDHYSYVDPRVSIYNFLRYSDRTWDLVNSPLHFQNRLRARDHLELFAGAGLRVLEFTENHPGPERRRALEATPLARRFANDYTLDELAVYAVEVTAAAPDRALTTTAAEEPGETSASAVP